MKLCLLPLGHGYNMRKMPLTWPRTNYRWGEQDRKGGRVMRACEQRIRGRGLWRAERHLKDGRGRNMRRRKMLLPGNCSESETSIFSSSQEDKNITGAKWTERAERKNIWSWLRGTEENQRKGRQMWLHNHHSTFLTVMTSSQQD